MLPNQSRLQVTQFTITDTGTSDDMIQQSFTSHLDQRAMLQFNEQTQGGSMISAETLSGLAGNIIRPDINSARGLEIFGGWGVKRHRFIMQLQYNNGMGANTRYIYTGYTDNASFDPMIGDFDRNMRIMFNNAISVTQTMIPTPSGLVPNVTVNDISHILNPRALGGGLQPILNPDLSFAVAPSTLRPSDVFVNLSTEARAREMGAPIQSLSTMADMKKASRSSVIASQYLDRSLNALKTAHETASPTTTEQQLYTTAMGYASDQYIHSDVFIGELVNLGFAMNGFVTWEALASIHPEIKTPEVIRYIRRQQAQEQISAVDGDKYVNRRGENEVFISSSGVNASYEAIIASSVMQSVPALFLTNFIGQAVLTATNMTMHGGVHVELRTPIAITELPSAFIMGRIPQLQQQLSRVIFQDLPVNKEVPFYIEMHVDVFGESFVRVSYNGGIMTPFSVPSYCDAMMSPLIAATQQPLIDISHDIRYLVGEGANHGYA